METFTKLRDFVDNPDFTKQRRSCLANLDLSGIDAPINEIIEGFAELSYCFTMQSCYGHFIHDSQEDPRNTEPLTDLIKVSKVEYRIAYLAICIEDSIYGKALFEDLKGIPEIDPQYIQFGCATWFWERQVNSYALQVEPRDQMTKDKIIVDFKEALHIERVRNQFFTRLMKVLQRQNPYPPAAIS